MDDWCWVWCTWLCDLLVLVLVDWLAARRKPDSNNDVNGLDLKNVNCGGNGDVLSLLQRHGGRQGQEGAESEGCG